MTMSYPGLTNKGCDSRLRRHLPWLLLALAANAAPAPAQSGGADAATRDQLRAAVQSAERPAADKVRDGYRHPLETLAFFGVKSDQTVLEIWPSKGWYTEILAPFLKDKGHYLAAVHGSKDVQAFADKYNAKPERYGKITVSALDAPKELALAPDGTVDLIVTFRNAHNWLKAGQADAVFAAFFKALKPGGTLGLVDHRADARKPQDPQATSGYVREDYLIKLAKKAGFTVVGKAEINANSKDTKDYPDGVWTLPPTLGFDKEHADRYKAIGESDRMTLLFRKRAKAAE